MIGVALASFVLASDVAGLWAAEGDTLESLVDASRGDDRGDALLRLAEWHRTSAAKLDPDSDAARIAAHRTQAESALVESATLSPPERMPQVLFTLGDLRRERKDAAGAAEAFGRLVQEYPEAPLAADASIALGDDAFEAGKLADAMERYSFALEKAKVPALATYARYKLAWCRLNLDEHDEALALLERVVRDGDAAKLSLADEARRDVALTLARHSGVSASDAVARLRGLVQGPRRLKLEEQYARLIAGSGRDEEAASVLDALSHEATPTDAVRLLVAELEIAVRRRDTGAVAGIATRVADLFAKGTPVDDASREAAERALRVAAVTFHGEGRSAADTARLELAVTLYRQYFRAFDKDEAAYELHHHAGELLLSLKRGPEAEVDFTAAVTRDLDRLGRGEEPGRWLTTSAHGAVVALQDALTCKETCTAAIGETEERFLAACDRYLKALPEGEHAVDVRYQRALVLFRHGKVEEALPVLRAVALETPDAPVATSAAELSLDALRRLSRFDELAALAEELGKRPAHAAAIGPHLVDVRDGALLSAADAEAKAGRHDAAARRYLAFVETSSATPKRALALYNAAASLTVLGHLDEAVAVRSRLLRMADVKDLNGKARRQQLTDLVALGRFRDAAPLARALSEESKGKDREQLLHDAIVLAEAAGDAWTTRQLRERFITRHAGGAKALAHALADADATKGCRARLPRLERALRLTPTRADRAVVLARLARTHEACGDKVEAITRARQAKALRTSVGSKADALDAIADASLLLAMQPVEAYRKLQIGMPYEKTIPRTLAALEKADAALAEVVGQGRASSATCALALSGDGYARLAEGLSAARAPRAFSEEQRAIFEEELAARAQPLFDKAKTTLVEALAKARDAAVDPSCLQVARARLARLEPGKWAPRAEAFAPLLPTAPKAAPVPDVLARAADAPAAALVAARAALTEGRAHAALLLAARVDKADPLTDDARLAEVGAFRTLQRDVAAHALLQQLADDGVETPLRVLATRRITAWDPDGLEPLLVQLHAQRPEDPAVVVALGVVASATGRPAQAESLLREALRLDPSSGEAGLALGLLLCGDGAKPADGLKLLEQHQAVGERGANRAAVEAALSACRALAGDKS